MKIPFPKSLLFAGLLFILPITTLSPEAFESYSDNEPPVGTDPEENEILSIEVTKTSLQLLLLGTITNDNVPKAIIKNPVTGELGTYAAGDTLDLVRGEDVKVLEISPCIILIERKGNFETMECSNKMPTVVFSGPAVLAKYKIASPRGPNSKLLSGNFITDYDRDIITVSEKHGVDPYLVKAVIKAESDFDPNAVSSKNAQGIMQLVPETVSDYGVMDPFDAKENMEGGVRYLKDLLEYFDGDMSLSLAAYNAGKGAVIKHGFTIPPYPETTDYISKVLGYYKLLKAKNYALKK